MTVIHLNKFTAITIPGVCHKGPINALLQSRSAQFLRFRRQTRNWTCGKQSLRLLQHHVQYTCTTVAAALSTVHLHHYTHQFGSVCIIRHSNNSFMVSLINLSATPNNNNNKSAATISSFDDTHCFVSLNCSSNCLEWSVCTHCPKALRRPTLMSAPT